MSLVNTETFQNETYFPIAFPKRNVINVISFLKTESQFSNVWDEGIY
jgi:hypothetical protein